jgi:hypothetical protein
MSLKIIHCFIYCKVMVETLNFLETTHYVHDLSYFVQNAIVYTVSFWHILFITEMQILFIFLVSSRSHCLSYNRVHNSVSSKVVTYFQHFNELHVNQYANICSNFLAIRGICVSWLGNPFMKFVMKEYRK